MEWGEMEEGRGGWGRGTNVSGGGRVTSATHTHHTTHTPLHTHTTLHAHTPHHTPTHAHTYTPTHAHTYTHTTYTCIFTAPLCPRQGVCGSGPGQWLIQTDREAPGAKWSLSHAHCHTDRSQGPPARERVWIHWTHIWEGVLWGTLYLCQVCVFMMAWCSALLLMSVNCLPLPHYLTSVPSSSFPHLRSLSFILSPPFPLPHSLTSVPSPSFPRLRSLSLIPSPPFPLPHSLASVPSPSFPHLHSLSLIPSPPLPLPSFPHLRSLSLIPSPPVPSPSFPHLHSLSLIPSPPLPLPHSLTSTPSPSFPCLRSLSLILSIPSSLQPLQPGWSHCSQEAVRVPDWVSKTGIWELEEKSAASWLWWNRSRIWTTWAIFVFLFVQTAMGNSCILVSIAMIATSSCYPLGSMHASRA